MQRTAVDAGGARTRNYVGARGRGGGDGLKTADAGRDVRNRGARDIARKQKARMRGAMRRMRASYHAQCLRVVGGEGGRERLVSCFLRGQCMRGGC
jgi:hypothetical protein